MSRQFAIAVRMTLVTLVLTGLLYPLLVTGLAWVLFPRAAAGSLVAVDGRMVGSALIGQRFSGPGWFQGRPSAAGAGGYDAVASGGSNLGPTSAKLRDRAAAELTRLAAENPERWRAPAGGAAGGLGQRARSAPEPRRGVLAGPARGGGARGRVAGRAGACGGADGTSDARLPRRTACECAAAEP